MGQLGAQMILHGLGLTPEARAAEEARRAEAAAEEARRQAEEDRRRDESRGRLLSDLKGLDSGPSSLTLKLGEPKPQPPLSEEERLIRSFLAAATRLGWRGEEYSRLERGLRGLSLDSLDLRELAVRDTWRAIEQRPAAEFAALASQGAGPGLPGAGRQNHEDCALFALANATGLPYSVVAARAGELIREGTWRTPDERANPQATMQRGLNGGEVVMLAEAFGRAEILTPDKFSAALREGRTVMVNVAPPGVNGGHQVVLTKTFQRGGETWYEMMDSNQGPMQRRYLSAGELGAILQEKGIAWQPDPGRTPALLR